MGTTTFSGPVRSENGFETVSKNATTGAVTITSGNKMAVEAVGGAGIEGTAGVYVTQVERFKSDTTTGVNIVKTTIMIDLTGLNCGGTAGDIIGADGAGVAHIGQVTAANQGTVFGVTMECFEAPTTGDPDIDLHSATEGTGVEDTAIGDLTETLIINGGDATLGSRTVGNTIAADQFLYLTCGTSTAGTYDAGKLVITILGFDAAS